VKPRGGLDDVKKRTFLILPGLKLQPAWSSSPLPVAILTTLSRLHIYIYVYSIYECFIFPQLGLVTDCSISINAQFLIHKMTFFDRRAAKHLCIMGWPDLMTGALNSSA
jgi:hypothetical protein